MPELYLIVVFDWNSGRTVRWIASGLVFNCCQATVLENNLARSSGAALIHLLACSFSFKPLYLKPLKSYTSRQQPANKPHQQRFVFFNRSPKTHAALDALVTTTGWKKRCFWLRKKQSLSNPYLTGVPNKRDTECILDGAVNTRCWPAEIFDVTTHLQKLLSWSQVHRELDFADGCRDCEQEAASPDKQVGRFCQTCFSCARITNRAQHNCSSDSIGSICVPTCRWNERETSKRRVVTVALCDGRT